ncbi:MAG: FG-GAP repeat protein [candidate division BRC1 bacterium ADurb.BinA364]|nr:MAG: FG-GAP repeat protein [candidate division BRC1 bacterium ADurb.BinA364]
MIRLAPGERFCRDMVAKRNEMPKTRYAALLGAALLGAAGWAAEPLAAWTWLAPEAAVESAASGEEFWDFGPDADGLLDWVRVDGKMRRVRIARQTARGIDDAGALEFSLPAGAWAWDFGDLDGQPGAEIAYLSNQGHAGAMIFGSAGPAAAKLFDFPDGPSGEAAGGAVRMQFLADLNGDGLLDIAMPGAETYDWAIQTAPGRFQLGPRIPARPERREAFRVRGEMESLFGPLDKGRALGEAGGGSFSGWGRILAGEKPPISTFHSRMAQGEQVELRDLNGDGRLDLFHPRPAIQSADGSFQSAAEAYSSAEDSMGFSETEGVIDIDGDGARDWFNATPPQSLRNAETLVALRLAPRAGAGEALSQERRFKGLWWGDPLADLNGDGALDLFLIDIRFDAASVNSQIKTFLGKGLDGELRVHFFNPGEGFSRAPDVTTPIRLLGDPMTFLFHGLPKLLFSADFTGDGRPDLLIRDASSRLSLYPYDPKARRYAARAAAALELPGELARDPLARDLNADGKSDLILYLAQKNNASEMFETRLYVALTR